MTSIQQEKGVDLSGQLYDNKFLLFFFRPDAQRNVLFFAQKGGESYRLYIAMLVWEHCLLLIKGKPSRITSLVKCRILEGSSIKVSRYLVLINLSIKV